MSEEREKRAKKGFERLWRGGLIVAALIIMGEPDVPGARQETSLTTWPASPVRVQGLNEEETKLLLPLLMNRYQPEWRLGEPIPNKIIGRNFTIHNERPPESERVAVHPFFGRSNFEGLIQKWKPGWKVEIRVVNSREEIPEDREGNPGGVGFWMRTPDGLKLYFAENVVYNREGRHLFYYFFPGEIFSSFGVEAMTPGSDRRADVSFTSELINALVFENDEFLYGFPDYPEGALDDLTRFDGRVDNGGLGIALFEWQLSPDANLDTLPSFL